MLFQIRLFIASMLFLPTKSGGFVLLFWTISLFWQSISNKIILMSTCFLSLLSIFISSFVIFLVAYCMITSVRSVRPAVSICSSWRLSTETSILRSEWSPCSPRCSTLTSTSIVSLPFMLFSYSFSSLALYGTGFCTEYVLWLYSPFHSSFSPGCCSYSFLFSPCHLYRGSCSQCPFQCCQIVRRSYSPSLRRRVYNSGIPTLVPSTL